MVLPAEETIVALSTPAGVGALAVIRLSGPEALTICQLVFHGKNLLQQPSHTLHFGTIRDGAVILDEVVVAIFRAPHSYTGEEAAEITTHGSPYIAQQVIQLLIRKGARSARPGEFTLRAFLNGRMDLSQAEAVADLIAAGSEAAHRTAMNQMRGGFSEEIRKLRGELIHFASLVELELDFSEEDVEFASRAEMQSLLLRLKKEVHELSVSFRLGNVIRHGVTTVIAGRPNAGKSTLLNALLNDERAIVSEIPGTTRDAIEEVIILEGLPFRLVDTAGLREATDVIEKEGVMRTLQHISRSAILVYVFDSSQATGEEVLKDLASLPAGNIPVVPVANKADLATPEVLEQFERLPDVLLISARSHEGLPLLRERLISLVWKQKAVADQTVVTNVRHYEALFRTEAALAEVLNGLQSGISKELLASDLRRALLALGEITGEITTDDLLESIFSKFCIGK